MARPLRFLTRGFGRGSAFPALQVMQQRGGNVGRTEALFEQALDKLVLPLELPALERGANFVKHGIGAGLFHFIHGGGFGAVNPRAHIALDGANLENLAPRGE